MGIIEKRVLAYAALSCAAIQTCFSAFPRTPAAAAVGVSSGPMGVLAQYWPLGVMAILSVLFFIRARPAVEFFQNHRALNKNRGGLAEELLSRAEKAWIVWPAGGATGPIPMEALRNVSRLVLRNPQAKRLEEDIERFHSVTLANFVNAVTTLTSRARQVGTEVKWHQNPMVSLIISDPHGSNAWARLEVLLPDTEPDKRPSVLITRKDSEELFKAYLEMYERLWAAADLAPMQIGSTVHMASPQS